MEQQQLKKCPIGIQTFEKIIEGNYLYVDKTKYVYRMVHGASNYCFLSRPRRFGKSLLTSTLHSYFAGKKDLFRGLAIEKLETEWTEYPVLHFDMSLAKHVDKDTLESMLSFQLSGYEQIYGKPEEAVKLNDRMTSLIMRANEQTGRQVVVLIDEYDAPLLDVMHEETDLPVLRNVMRNFYSPLKACVPDRHYQILPTQHLQRAEQYLEYQYAEALCRHLWHHSGRNAGTDDSLYRTACRFAGNEQRGNVAEVEGEI